MQHRPMIAAVASQKQKRRSEITCPVGRETKQLIKQRVARHPGLFGIAMRTRRNDVEERKMLELPLHLRSTLQEQDDLRQREKCHNRGGTQRLGPRLSQITPVEN